MGVEYVVNAQETSMKQLMEMMGMKEGFDVGLEMSGSPHAMRDMIDAMNNGGKLALLGIAPVKFEIDWNKVIFKMLHIKGIYGREIFETWYKMIALVQSGLDVSGLITHRIPIADFEAGFEAMRDGSAGKVVMNWD
jgi:threonine 3-dehydrogenase